MQHIKDFWHEKEDTPYTMYTYLIWLVVESRGIFAKSQLIKIFLSKINRRLLDIDIEKNILNYDCKTTLAQAFTKVKKYNRVIYQHDAIDIIA